MDEGKADSRIVPWPEAAGRSRQKAEKPPDQTGAEQFFYRKHMQRRTPMVVVLVTGEEHRGWIEWYDRDILKLHSFSEANLFLRKDEVKCIYRHEDDPQGIDVPTPPPVQPRRGGRRRGGRRRHNSRRS